LRDHGCRRNNMNGIDRRTAIKVTGLPGSPFRSALFRTCSQQAGLARKRLGRCPPRAMTPRLPADA
jgi:hypothetical protein